MTPGLDALDDRKAAPDGVDLDLIQRLNTDWKEDALRLLDHVDCVSEGDRDLRLEIGDRVAWTTNVSRHTVEIEGEITLRIYRRFHVDLKGRERREGQVVGARTLQSGQYREGYMTRTYTGTPRHVPDRLDVWRTHRVYIVTPGLFRQHETVLSDDLTIIGEEEVA